MRTVGTVFYLRFFWNLLFMISFFLPFGEVLPPFKKIATNTRMLRVFVAVVLR